VSISGSSHLVCPASAPGRHLASEQSPRAGPRPARSHSRDAPYATYLSRRRSTVRIRLGVLRNGRQIVRLRGQPDSIIRLTPRAPGRFRHFACPQRLSLGVGACGFRNRGGPPTAAGGRSRSRRILFTYSRRHRMLGRLLAFDRSVRLELRTNKYVTPLRGAFDAPEVADKCCALADRAGVAITRRDG